MKPLDELQDAWRIAAGDVRRAFRTRRMRALLASVLVLETLPSGIRIWADPLLANGDPGRQRELTGTVAKLLGEDAARAMAFLPSPLVALVLLTVMTAPLLVTIAGFDAIAGDVERRSIAFFLARVSRRSLVIGRWLALCGSTAVVLLVAHAALWLPLLALGTPETRSELLSAAPRLWLGCVATTLPYAAWVTLLSTLPGPSSLLLVLALGSTVGFWLLRAAGTIPLELRRWLLPNANDSALLAGRLHDVTRSVVATLCWSTVVVALATLVLARRSLRP